MINNKILLEIIVTNQCNKRCDYCDLNFTNNVISKSSIKAFYDKFVNERNSFDSLYINFFWGEPLLNFDLIKYSILLFKNIKNIKFSVWTNWDLLTQEKLKYFELNNVDIYLSIDFDNLENFINTDKLNKYRDIININFIIQPKRVFELYAKLIQLLNMGFNSFNIMPVYTTQNWDNEQLLELSNIHDKLNKIKSSNICFFNYYKWITSEKQFILDTDWTLYNDIDSLLWLQKQYKIIPLKLKELINKTTDNWNINDDNLRLSKVFNNYNHKILEKIILSIPKITKTNYINKKIEKIFNN